MDVILLERVGKLGQMGDVVSVKPGYARNFLLPQGKALRATKANKEQFETQRAQLEALNLESKKEAEALAEKLGGATFIAIRQAGDSGQLYGSVTTRDIAAAVTEGGFTLEKRQVVLDMPIKVLGLHDVTVTLHPEVDVSIIMNVARSADEAERQARGEDVTAIIDDDEDEDEDDINVIAPEEIFDEEALEEGALEELEDATTDNADTAEDTASAAPENAAEEDAGEDREAEKS